MVVTGNIISVALQAYLFLLFVRMVLSWVPALNPEFQPHGVILVIFEVVYTLTDPPIKFFTKLLPDVRIGRVAFSLGYLAAIVVVTLLLRINALIFFR